MIWSNITHASDDFLGQGYEQEEAANAAGFIINADHIMFKLR